MESRVEYTADGNYLTKITTSDRSSTSYNYNTTKGPYRRDGTGRIIAWIGVAAGVVKDLV